MSAKTEPLIAALKKTRAEFQKTPQGKLQLLCAERSKWSRRATIARNKLSEIEDKIDSLCLDLALEVMNHERKG